MRNWDATLRMLSKSSPNTSATSSAVVRLFFSRRCQVCMARCDSSSSLGVTNCSRLIEPDSIEPGGGKQQDAHSAPYTAEQTAWKITRVKKTRKNSPDRSTWWLLRIHGDILHENTDESRQRCRRLERGKLSKALRSAQRFYSSSLKRSTSVNPATHPIAAFHSDDVRRFISAC